VKRVPPVITGGLIEETEATEAREITLSLRETIGHLSNKFNL
jgi:hypothetical protein